MKLTLTGTESWWFFSEGCTSSMMLWRRSIGMFQDCGRKDANAIGITIGFKRLIDHSFRGEYVAAQLSNYDCSRLCVAQKYNHGESQRDKVLPEGLPCPTPTYMSNSENRICMKSLQDMVLENFHSMEADDYLDLIITTLRPLVEKIWRFHRSQITHGNLKPENVFMCNGEFTLTNLVNDGSNSLGWKAPEQLLSYTQIKASDMFSFGYVLCFCITGGCHPFGDDPNQRIESILQNKVNLSQVEDIPDAFDLISLLLSPNPESRLKANEVASHPLFMNLYCKTSLLKNVCCLVNQDKEFAEGLKSTIPTLADPNWCDTTMRYGPYILYMARFQIKLQNVFGSPRSPGFLSRTVLRIFKQHKHEKWFIRKFVWAEDHLEGMDDEEYCYEIDEYSCDED